jgi:hypothetical protein
MEAFAFLAGRRMAQNVNNGKYDSARYIRLQDEKFMCFCHAKKAIEY